LYVMNAIRPAKGAIVIIDTVTKYRF
jgi:hypothetical protein